MSPPAYPCSVANTTAIEGLQTRGADRHYCPGFRVATRNAFIAVTVAVVAASL